MLPYRLIRAFGFCCLDFVESGLCLTWSETIKFSRDEMLLVITSLIVENDFYFFFFSILTTSKLYVLKATDDITVWMLDFNSLLVLEHLLKSVEWNT